MAEDVRAKSDELAKQLWAIANEFRGNMDASEFKNYILGLIFYRYLSEKTENYMNELLKDDEITYSEALANPKYTDVVKEWSLEHLGYIILPKNMWSSLIELIDENALTVEDLEKAVNSLTASTIGQESEAAFRGLFNDMNLKADHLGREVSERTALISKVMQKIDALSFAVKDTQFDYLGTAYMILIGLFQSGAGKKAGEFFTATCASKLVARLATGGLQEVKYACDPCAGSGSLLLEVKNSLPEHKVGHFYSQELNSTTYNLNRMNMLLHGVPYRQFTAYNDDTLRHDNFMKMVSRSCLLCRFLTRHILLLTPRVIRLILMMPDIPLVAFLLRKQKPIWLLLNIWYITWMMMEGLPFCSLLAFCLEVLQKRKLEDISLSLRIFWMQ